MGDDRWLILKVTAIIAAGFVAVATIFVVPVLVVMDALRPLAGFFGAAAVSFGGGFIIVWALLLFLFDWVEREIDDA